MLRHECSRQHVFLAEFRKQNLGLTASVEVILHVDVTVMRLRSSRRPERKQGYSRPDNGLFLASDQIVLIELSP